MEAVEELLKGCGDKDSKKGMNSRDSYEEQKEIILIGLVAEFVRKWPQVVRKIKSLF